ncbi:Esterase/lipase/thioesterase family active site [Prochlorococcus marinus str. NATL1A]|uniref:Esterase/lipase/thioesterase family active site n=1 Tax=Prochlorococcus marinus (strain NATL1A) TaxID=167555 RepID=A2BZN7_PROM1|nr:prolyl oligopeptidase family serine peptidase [Prochlorococcus marinus]ABM74697.1 Esterase/lipase/thioesterase family active site [Prochlorococcus marinus str. NATL1A]
MKNKTMRILDAEKVYGEAPIFKEPRIIGDWILWLEQRPNEKGRTTALIRPWGQKDVLPQELTPYPSDLRTKIHGYGGAPLTATLDGSDLILTWVDNKDNRLWMRTWFYEEEKEKSFSFKFIPKIESICLTKKHSYFLAGGVIDLEKNIWIGLMEDEEGDHIVSYSLNKSEQYPKIIYSSQGLLGYLALNSKDRKLAWVEWKNTSMPWDLNELKLAKLGEKENIINVVTVNNEYLKCTEKISFFNPIWSDTGDLFVAEDSSGWWNITQIKTDLNNNSITIFQNQWTIKAEIAFPQWVLGMSSFSCVGDNVVGAFAQEGIWTLALFQKDGSIKTFDQTFIEFSGIHSHQNRLVAIASSAEITEGIFEIDLLNQSWEHTPASSFSLDPKEISIGESFWFIGSNEEKVHAWYYPPLNKQILLPPLLVKSHSGPTGMARCGLDLEVQFWTSRGWAVVDVNYGGSSGFGREYRDRLRGNWGVIDVMDCTKAAQSLIASGKADKDRIAIMGSSASGFTALGCLISSDIFNIGACKYAVTDLIGMANSTHRFEEFYLDYLIGNIETDYEKYLKRSPIENVNFMNMPLILFHGLKDKVIPSDQSIAIKDELLKREIPVQINLFENEGHGFKDGKIKVDVLNKTEAFFRQYLNI